MVEAICREAIDSLLNEERRVNLIGALSKYHTESEQLLRNWSTVWLSQAFSSWDIRERLRSIESPVLAIQARDDAYGTMAQLDAIEKHIAHATCLRLEKGGHSPHLSPPLRLSERIAEFIQQVHS
jgi:pimeloyl-ACP methyl ester carboxylesterase